MTGWEEPNRIADDGPGTVLCELADINDPGSREFYVAGRPPFFVIRKGDSVAGYINSCPHQGLPLNWRKDVFLSYDKVHIQCVHHIALFDPMTGDCLYGPCFGERLMAFAVRVEAGKVVLGA